jgi:hypothetical protein
MSSRSRSTLSRELQAVTPDSLQYLLHDLFEVNTFLGAREHTGEAVMTSAMHTDRRSFLL